MGSHRRPALVAALPFCAMLLLLGCGGAGGGGDGTQRAAFPVVFFEDTSAPNDADGGIPQPPVWSVGDDDTGLVTLAPAGTGLGQVIRLVASPDRQWLALLMDYDVTGKFELFVVPITGGALVKVSGMMPDAGDVANFDWSPDSTRLVYSADQDIDNVREIYMVDRTGANRMKINGSVGAPPQVAVERPLWSPDGRYIAQRVRDLATNRYIGINLYDTTLGKPNSTRITPPVPSTKSITDPRWSPDSTRISFMEHVGTAGSFVTAPNTRYLFVCTVGGSCPQVSLTGLDVAGVFTAQQFWSPDGSRLAYLADDETGGLSSPGTELVYVDALDGQPSKTVNNGVNEEVFDGSPVWSPDSAQLAYVTVGKLKIWTRATDTNRTVNAPLGPRGAIKTVAWSPDGQRIAFLESDDAGLPFVLFIGQAHTPGATQVTGFEHVASYAWAPDAGAIAAIARETGSSVDELFVAAADGTGAVKVNDTPPDFGTGLTPAVYKFAWAPDSARIVYMGGTMDNASPAAMNFGLFSVARGDGSVIRLGGDLKALDFTY